MFYCFQLASILPRKTVAECGPAAHSLRANKKTVYKRGGPSAAPSLPLAVGIFKVNYTDREVRVSLYGIQVCSCILPTRHWTWRYITISLFMSILLQLLYTHRPTTLYYLQ